MLVFRPPFYALVCVSLWAIQLAVHAGVLVLHGQLLLHQDWAAWFVFSLVCNLGIGSLLLMQLPKALQWRPRLNPRPSAEVQQERRRIARDLHDQIGSQLVSAMSLLDAGDPSMARQTLEQCMLDTRLLVDSMDGHDDALTDSLARLRHRLQPVLERRGIRLEWSVEWADGVPAGPCARELTYVVREAVSNVLQHAAATEVEVSLALMDTPAGRHWHLTVSDNGRGLPPGGLVQTGLGIASMRERVSRAGGSLQLHDGVRGGVDVRVVVPFAR